MSDLLDFGLSYISGRAADNRVRFQVESRTRIDDVASGRTERFYQCASCKSENTFAERDLFMEDNYDFLPIFGGEHGVVFRRKAACHDRYRQTRPAGEWWGGQVYRLAPASGVRELTSFEQIAAATHAARPLIAVTRIDNAATGLRATIEYPVKTMNVREHDRRYQVDTGPVAWPDLSRRRGRPVDLLSLAFVAFNAPHFADFVIEAPTAVGEGGGDTTLVHHYCKRVSLPAANRLFAIDPAPGGAP